MVDGDRDLAAAGVPVGYQAARGVERRGVADAGRVGCVLRDVAGGEGVARLPGEPGEAGAVPAGGYGLGPDPQVGGGLLDGDVTVAEPLQVHPPGDLPGGGDTGEGEVAVRQMP